MRYMKDYRIYAMVNRVDPSAYACDIDSSLKRLKSLVCDESPYLNSKDLRRKGASSWVFVLRHACYTAATVLRLRQLSRMAMISSLGALASLVLTPNVICWLHYKTNKDSFCTLLARDSHTTRIRGQLRSTLVYIQRRYRSREVEDDSRRGRGIIVRNALGLSY